jgi:hypothetical protein
VKRWVGRWLLGVGAIHTGYGLWAFAAPLRAIGADGFWNAVDADPGRRLAFWFLFTGFVFLLTGALVDHTEAQEAGRLPWFVGYALLLLGVGGAVLIPVSAIWLLIPPAAAVLWRARPGALKRHRS